MEGSPGPRFPKLNKFLAFVGFFLVVFLDVLQIVFIFVLGPALPRGVPGEGPECHFPKEIVGFGPLPARFRGFAICILALSAARMTGF